MYFSDKYFFDCFLIEFVICTNINSLLARCCIEFMYLPWNKKLFLFFGNFSMPLKNTFVMLHCIFYLSTMWQQPSFKDEVEFEFTCDKNKKVLKDEFKRTET